MTITALPTPPQRSDPANFAARGDAFMTALPTFATEANALQTDVNAKQVAAAASQTAASTSETNAAASEAAAGANATATIWISGTTYAIGDARFSPTNFITYRRKTNGAGTTDPISDGTNWQALVPVMATASEVKVGTSTTTTISPATLYSAMGISAYVQIPDQTITNAALLTVAHGLGRAPIMLQGFLKNTSAELGYSINDITPINLGSDNGSNPKGVAVTFDATNMYIRFSDGGGSANTFLLCNKTSGAVSTITNGNWKFFLRVWA